MSTLAASPRLPARRASLEARSALRLAFWVAGGPQVGMGHVFRSLELARTLESHGIEIVGFACNDDTRSRDLIQQAGRTGWSETELPADQIDVILVDRPTGADKRVAAWQAAHAKIRLAALDDFQMEATPSDLVINLINHHPTRSRPVSPYVAYHEGPAYAIVRSEFLAARLRSRVIAPSAKELVITFGGADPANHSARVLEAVAAPAFSGLRVRLVIGPNFARAAALEAQARVQGVEVIRNAPNLAGLFSGADVAISGGGTTMLELACLGTPTLVIPQNRAEARFSASLAARGAVMALPSEVKTAQLRSTLAGLLEDPAARRRLHDTARRVVDGRGQERIADLLLTVFAPYFS